MRRLSITLIVLAAVLTAAFCSPAIEKEWQQEFSYKDPQTIGGLWDVTFQDGTTMEGLRCEYWGTTDDTSVWRDGTGRRIIQSGACYAVEHR